MILLPTLKTKIRPRFESAFAMIVLRKSMPMRRSWWKNEDRCRLWIEISSLSSYSSDYQTAEFLVCSIVQLTLCKSKYNDVRCPLIPQQFAAIHPLHACMHAPEPAAKERAGVVVRTYHRPGDKKLGNTILVKLWDLDSI